MGVVLQVPEDRACVNVPPCVLAFVGIGMRVSRKYLRENIERKYGDLGMLELRGLAQL